MGSENFNYSIPFVLEHEGGLCNTSGDAGGLTNFGICQRSYPDLDIQNLTRDDAITIYGRDFWQSSWDQLDKRVAAKVFDISVNCGEAWGPKILQRALGVTDDGIIGPATIAAANGADPEGLLGEMVTVLDHHYEAIVQEHPGDQKFLDGWEHRAGWIPA
jgi:lysozyme family protein